MWASVDSVTWQAVTYAIGYVRSVCEGGMGYALLGQYKAIGVATWGIGSPYDKRMQQYFPSGPPSVTAFAETPEESAGQGSIVEFPSNIDSEAS